MVLPPSSFSLLTLLLLLRVVVVVLCIVRHLEGENQDVFLEGASSCCLLPRSSHRLAWNYCEVMPAPRSSISEQVAFVVFVIATYVAAASVAATKSVPTVEHS